MSGLNAIGETDNWICWLCDKLLDPGEAEAQEASNWLLDRLGSLAPELEF